MPKNQQSREWETAAGVSNQKCHSMLGGGNALFQVVQLKTPNLRHKVRATVKHSGQKPSHLD